MVVQVLAYEPDLMFSSRIESAARKLGLEVKVASNIAELNLVVKESVPKVMLVNLDAVKERGESCAELVRVAKSKIIGYYSHLDSKFAEEALAAGFEFVIPRRAFAVEVHDILSTAGSG